MSRRGSGLFLALRLPNDELTVKRFLGFLFIILVGIHLFAALTLHAGLPYRYSMTQPTSTFVKTVPLAIEPLAGGEVDIPTQ